ncbi:MAG: response regulator [Phycisphaerales bacterium]|jgi:two-component system, cell cycle sensor histidine kinase and response regulator CckA|nr:response regulator [Phycisphaerales bacterium]
MHKKTTIQSAPPTTTKHILVVDDDTAVRHLTKSILSSQGYDVTQCSDGAKAVDIYAKLGKEIDLVILDMLMPDMNGVETFRLLKQINPRVNAILCSAFVPDFNGRLIAEEGFSAFIAKPFAVTEFLKLTKRHTK